MSERENPKEYDLEEELEQFGEKIMYCLPIIAESVPLLEFNFDNSTY